MNIRQILIHYSALGALSRPQTYRNIAYLLLSFPLGLIYFIFLVVGWAVGMSLAVILIGIPILLLTFIGSLALIAFERWLANFLLGAHLESPYNDIPADANLLEQIKAIVKNRANIKGIAYLFLKFPLGLASFILVILAGALPIGLLLAPLHYHHSNLMINSERVDTLPEALLASLLGLVIGLFAFSVLNWVADGWRSLTATMLGGVQEKAKGRRTVTIRPYNSNADYADYEEEKLKRAFADEEDAEIIHLAKPKREIAFDFAEEQADSSFAPPDQTPSATYSR